MKNIAIFILVAVIILGGSIYFVRGNHVGRESSQESSDKLMDQNEQMRTGDAQGKHNNIDNHVSVRVKKDFVELFGPGDTKKVPGTGQKKETDILIVTIDGVDYTVYDTNDLVRVANYSLSPDGKFLFVLRGEISQDAMVRPNIFDVNSKKLECIRTEDVPDCSYENGWPLTFASESSIKTIEWESNGLLYIKYNNPFLAPGAPESGPSIGLQVFKSVSTETPWIVEQAN